MRRWRGCTPGFVKGMWSRSMLRSYILLVDDDPEYRNFLSAVFERRTLKVKTAWNGQDALKVVAAEPVRPFLVICDAVMPVMDGFELSRVASRHPQLQNVPFVMMTWYPFGPSIASTIRTTDCWTKPVDPDKAAAYAVNYQKQWLDGVRRSLRTGSSASVEKL